MKLLCIDDINYYGRKHPFLDFGETYEAIGEAVGVSGEPCYIIPGLPNSVHGATGRVNKMPLYRKTRFIELTDQPEEVTEELELATA